MKLRRLIRDVTGVLTFISSLIALATAVLGATAFKDNEILSQIIMVNTYALPVLAITYTSATEASGN